MFKNSLKALIVGIGLFGLAHLAQAATLSPGTPGILTPGLWIPNQASSTITPNPNTLQVPCANIVGGCSGGGSGVTTSTVLNLQSSTASYVANLNTVLSIPSNYASVGCFGSATTTDIGACTNLAYGLLPSSGGEIVEPAGSYTYATPIVFGTQYKVVTLFCPSGGGGANFSLGGGTTLIYSSSTGSAFTVNTNNYVVSGSGITNCDIQGLHGTTAASTIGVNEGGAFGAFSFELQNVTVSGFGTGQYEGQNTSFITDLNTVLNFNGVDLFIPQISGANGENFRYIGGTIADSNNQAGGPTENFCINNQISGNTQVSFNATSIDDCQYYDNQSGGTANITKFTNVHFENPDLDSYDFISMLSSQLADTIDSEGTDYMNDKVAGMSEFVTNGGHFVSNGDTVEINHNVTTPVTNFVNNQDNTDTLSWTGLNQGYANTSASAAISNVVNGWGAYTPDGYETGIGPLSFVVNPSTPNGATYGGIGSVDAANFENVLYATQYGGTNIGAQVNNAYAAAVANGNGSGTIIEIPAGNYSYSTGIVCGTAGFRCLIEGAPGGGTTLNYTGTGAAITLNYGVQGTGIMHADGQGVSNLYLIGNTSATTTPQIGILVGGTSPGGGEGTVISNLGISTFGVGLELATNTYNFTMQTSIIRNSGYNVLINAPANSGESDRFLNDFIVDGANNNPTDCFLAQNSANSSLVIQGTSFDDCQVHLQQAILSATFTGDYWENPGHTAWLSYPYLLVDNNAVNQTTVTGGLMMNDASSSAQYPAEFISNGGTMTIDGLGAYNNASGHPNTVPVLVLETGSAAHTVIQGYNNEVNAVQNTIGTSGVVSNYADSTSTIAAALKVASTFTVTSTSTLIGNVTIGTSTNSILPLDVEGAIGSGQLSGGGDIRSYQDATNDYVSLTSSGSKSGFYRNTTNDFMLYYDTTLGNTVLNTTFTGASMLFQYKGTTYATLNSSGTFGINTLNVTSSAKFNGAITLATASSSFTTGSIGGGSLTAGTCASTTTALDSSVVTSSAAFITTPKIDPGPDFYWETVLIASSSVSTRVCAAGITGTPTGSTYNVKILQ